MGRCAALAVLVLLVAVAARAQVPHRPPSVHAREAAVAGPVAVAPRAAPGPVAPLAARDRAPTAEVLGFYPYWKQDAYRTLDWSLLSTVAWFSVELDGRGAVAATNGWPWRDLVDQAHRNGVAVLLTATLFDEAALDSLLSRPECRAAAATALTDLAADGGADGVMVDFENVAGTRRADLVVFLEELRVALEAGLATPRLAATIPPEDWNGAYDTVALARSCDHLVVMAYDYHGYGSPTTGPVAPLYGRGLLSVSRSVDRLLDTGVAPGRLLLGVPYYGYEWGAADGDAGAVTTDAGLVRRYEEAAVRAELHAPRWHSPSATPWLAFDAPQWRQLWYDDAESLSAKYALGRDRGLAGVSIWALGYDGSRPELRGALAAAFSSHAPDAGSAGIVLSHAERSPFRESAVVRWSLPRAAAIRVSVYDARGRRVRRLFSGHTGATGRIRWDGRTEAGGRAPTGPYLLRLEADGDSAALRLLKID